MCGICGIINSELLPPHANEWIRAMSSTIQHRGPDDVGYYIGDMAALGTRRLSVIDIAGGIQPVSNTGKTVWLVFNGEIYNYQELRRSLETRGHQFRTQSDTEVIIHAYEEYGTECPKHLVGMFAFAIWDAKQKRLFAARDRLGQKPFFYYQHKDLFCFGSELKTLLQIPIVPDKLNPIALHHYLSLQYVPDSMSIYQGIQKLPAAHWLTFEKGDIHLERYWHLDFESKKPLDENEASEELHRLLKQSVHRRMISDVPLGAFLSGGVDSSIIVALMAEQSMKPVKTFSIGFTHEKLNESPYARAIAKHFKTEHHEFVMTADRFENLIPAVTAIFDEPFADASAVLTYHLAKEAKRHVTVALNGDGADELFAGYPRYWMDKYVHCYTALPKLITQNLVPAFVDRLPETTQTAIEANWVLGLKRLAQASRISSKASILRWGSFFDETMKSQLYNKNMQSLVKDANTSILLERDFDRSRASSFLDSTLSVDTKNYLCGDILVKTDMMTMAHSLEARSPFLDHELAEFAACMPTNFKVKGRLGKYLLRKTFQKTLPPNILDRPKRGFGAPIETWLRHELRSTVHDLLLSPNSQLSKFFCPVKIAKMVTEHEQRKCDHGRRIWSLLMLEGWLNQGGKKSSVVV